MKGCGSEVLYDGGEAMGWAFWCPGCDEPHRVPRDGRWTFDGNWERPTFSPSLLSWADYPDGRRCCHLFIRDGHLEFLGDCTHALAGQRVPMVPHEMGWAEDEETEENAR